MSFLWSSPNYIFRYLTGEKHTVLRDTSITFKKRLYWVKGKRNCRVVEVPFTVKSLNQGDVFILDASERIFVWNGPHSNNGEKIRVSSDGLDILLWLFGWKFLNDRAEMLKYSPA